MTALINKDFNRLYNLPENTIFEFDLLWRECLEIFLDVVFTKFPAQDLPDQHIEGGYNVGVKMNWEDTEYTSNLFPTIEQALCDLFLQYGKPPENITRIEDYYTSCEDFHEIVKNVYGAK